MYRQVITPTEKNHTISLPPSLFGKEVEVIVNEIEGKQTNTPLPSDLKDQKFWDDIVFNPEFPSASEIRSSAWPLRQW